jgi:hypothetical protein
MRMGKHLTAIVDRLCEDVLKHDFNIGNELSKLLNLSLVKTFRRIAKKNLGKRVRPRHSRF